MEIELGASKKEETGSKRNGIGQKARVITSVSIHLYFCFIFSPLPANFEREKTKFKPSQAETKWKKKYIFWDDIKVLYIGTTLFQFFFLVIYSLSSIAFIPHWEHNLPSLPLRTFVSLFLSSASLPIFSFSHDWLFCLLPACLYPS